MGVNMLNYFWTYQWSINQLPENGIGSRRVHIDANQLTSCRRNGSFFPPLLNNGSNYNQAIQGGLQVCGSRGFVGRFVGAAHGCPVGFACEKILQSFSVYNFFKDFVFTGGFKFSFRWHWNCNPVNFVVCQHHHFMVMVRLESPSKWLSRVSCSLLGHLKREIPSVYWIFKCNVDACWVAGFCPRQSYDTSPWWTTSCMLGQRTYLLLNVLVAEGARIRLFWVKVDGF